MSTQVRQLRLDLKSFTIPSVVHRLRPAEMVAAGLTLGLVLLTILYYFMSLAPVRDQLSRVETEAADQIKVIAAQPAPTQGGPSQKEQIQLAKNSLADFEGGNLKPIAQGRIDLINEINMLAKADNLRLGSGIDMHGIYRPAATPEADSQPSKRKKDVEALDVFPRVQFHFVVKGEYKELRKFLRDLEGSKQYVVVDSVNLSNSEQKQGRGSKAAAAQLAPGSALSLTVSMNAYFRP